jgi:hypothetical protein
MALQRQYKSFTQQASKKIKDFDGFHGDQRSIGKETAASGDEISNKILNELVQSPRNES